MKILTSSTPALKPVSIYDIKTGEAVSYSELQNKLEALTSLVKTQAQNLLISKWNQLIIDCQDYAKINPAEFSRQRGYNPDISSFPPELKAKSRVQKLIGYSLISTVSAYVSNANPKKQPPRIGKVLNLAAGDKQLSSLSYEDGLLTLLFKCYDTEYLLDFAIPNFILNRTITKWCLPTITFHKNEYVFRFPYQEQVNLNKANTLKAGIDLGRAEPYTVAIINEKGQRVAHYLSSGKLKNISHKRDRLLSEKRLILAKIDSYKKLGLDPVVLQKEANRKRSKITRLGIALEHTLGNEVARKLKKHNLSILHVENLKWVTGKKYGSKWNHSKQQAAIQHSLYRNGTRSKRVNPRNTSQECHKCGTTLIHNSKNRTVWCVECKTRLDRDYNAAINIAKNKNAYPRPREATGITVDKSQIMDESPSSSNRTKTGKMQLTSFLT